MEKSDIKVILDPHKELLEWWDYLNEINQVYVKEWLGFLVELIKVEY